MIADRPHVQETDDGAVRVASSEWRNAWWVAVPCLLMGLPLLPWAALHLHWVELGGALVFLAFGALAAYLPMSTRIDVRLSREGESVRVRGRRGVGPLSRSIDEQLGGATRVVVRPLLRDGESADSAYGADLELEDGSRRFRLARRMGLDADSLVSIAERLDQALSA